MKNSKDYNYFNAFVELSKFSLKAAEFLNTTLNEFKVETIEQKVIEMHLIEHSADDERHEIMNRLVKEFLPPIEREDIISLADNIDNVVDSIEDVLIVIEMYDVQAIRPEIFKFTELIINCCKSLNSALVEFHNFKKSKILHDAIIDVNRLEEEGDKLYINSMRSLFKNTKDPIELMVYKEIYHLLEKCCDNCEDVANDIENIVMKNS
jgi:predicted phosphate transport protein (TIGR00153 family)